MSEYFQMELSSPITDEEWAIITDAELERTSEITFNTPSGKKVVFIKKPTVDAVEVVRCKDCKWYGRADKRRFYRGMDCLQKRIDTIIPDKDFCSRAERREE